jgi:CRISPR type III-A-associated RAMP protein Csm4
MNPALLVRMRPISPWRTGPSTGARDRVDTLYHSDSLYSAITNSLRVLGADLEEWFRATAQNSSGSAVRFSSVFPLFTEHLLATPPRTAWPPQASAKMRWKGARYVPLSLIPQILASAQLDEDQWAVDGASECVVPANMGGPFKSAIRSSAAVDRLNGNAAPHSAACIEFQSGGGLWFLVSYADLSVRDAWDTRVKSAVRLLADSGFGGERGRGWGRTASPSFTDGEFPSLILPGLNLSALPDSDQHWLLSLYSPAESDAVEWARGNYAAIERGGWVESPVQSGAQKKRVRMIEEGSVLAASSAPVGRAPDVAPEGFPHPVFRAGFALSITLPSGGAQ